MEYTHEGITFSKHYVRVHWKGSVGSSVRFCTVKVPWDALVGNEDFMEALGHATAAYLKSKWSMNQDDYPLF